MYNIRKISLAGILVGLLLFSGCSREDILTDESSGKTGTVQISVDGVEELSDGDVITRSLTDEKENSTVFTQTLDNGYTLVCTLEKERRNNIKTRASVPTGVQYCIVAYKDGGDAEADSRQAIFTTGSVSGLTLPPGTYQLYAYSYNRSTVEKLSGNDLRDARIPYKESVDKQFLYWRGSKKVIVAADGTVTNGNISILFRRQTCELKIMLDGRDTGTQITGGGISVSPFRSGFFDTRLSNGGTWNMSTIQNESGDLNLNRPFNINNMASSVCYIIPKATEDRRTVKLIDISINSEPGKKSKTFAFTKKFERGYKYTLKIKIEDTDINLDVSGGGANCFMVTNNSRYYKFTPSLNYGNGNFTSGMAQANGTPVSIKLLWQDTPSLIKNVGFANNQIRFKVGGNSGNALIAAFNSSNKVVWSWHIWVTDYDPNREGLVGTVDGQAAMNRNLGAVQAASRQFSREFGSYGLYYQWGRKNPFLVKHQDYSALYDINNSRIYWPASRTSTSAARNVSHPMEFKNIGVGNGIIGGTMGTLSSSPNRTWWGVNSTKTAYDPCPRGYRVMRQRAGGGIVLLAKLLVPQAGRLQCTSFPGAAYPIQGPDCIGGLDLVWGGVAMLWLNDMMPSNNIGGSSDQIATGGYAMHIDYGKPVRCVKE